MTRAPAAERSAPADTHDLSVIAKWLHNRAKASYNGARIAYAKGEDSLALLLYEEADTARRWVKEIEADIARQTREANRL